MIPQFDHLSTEERKKMYDAVARVALLIAGADGKIDPEETEWAKKLTEIRSYSYDDVMQEFYATIDDQFEAQLYQMVEEYPDETEARTNRLKEELAELNPIINKVDPVFARHYFDSLVSFARHVAEASGGFLRFGNISKAEKDLINLPMIEKPD